ncbi:TetR/AcrR family transcriptional regulator [Furfurilactobacillus siliginis]|uniref:AcrR family transcriptional regulator n=1 Tax=Furfurilactobacillus siliginis TaxID=348151 RepID=A0A510VW86_9LACO|nr:TetR/AcrR family transcriptional regulator [Furfurilactobacillus siliginis]GEK29060.1 AcrR family transcriptional regulator [Furfurilactobacillus siliginis]
MTEADFRSRRTTRRIEQALIKLLQDSPFEKITVAQLCAAATVSRSTFYAHYYDKYAIAERLVSTYQTQLENRLAQRFERGNVADVQAMIAPLFKWLMTDSVTTRTLMKLHLPDADLTASLHHELTKHFTAFMLTVYRPTTKQVPLDYLVAQYVSWVMTELDYQLQHGENAAVLAFSQQAQNELFELANIAIE